MHYNKYIDVYQCIINKYLKNAFIPWLKPWAFSLFNCVTDAEPLLTKGSDFGISTYFV